MFSPAILLMTRYLQCNTLELWKNRSCCCADVLWCLEQLLCTGTLMCDTSRMMHWQSADYQGMLEPVASYGKPMKLQIAERTVVVFCWILLDTIKQIGWFVS